MLLDAPALEARLTPEIAMGVIQKELQRKGWKEQQINEIKLVYTPYWIFGFDVLAGAGPSPTGKAALNAYTGEINDFVPMLIERPVKRTRETMAGAHPEVEQTAVSYNEVKQVAATKVAAHVGGLKTEQITVSAVSKIYVPSYRLWVDVAGDTFKFEIDAALGYPTGLDALPKRQQGWDEATKETLEKMKTPKGWVELGGKAAGLAGGVAGEAAKGGDEKNKLLRYAFLAAVILALAWLVFGTQSFRQNVSCALDDEFAGKPAWFGLVPSRTIPGIKGDVYYVAGSCSFTNEGSTDAVLIARLAVNGKSGNLLDAKVITASPPANSKEPSEKEFELNWTEPVTQVDFSFEKI